MRLSPDKYRPPVVRRRGLKTDKSIKGFPKYATERSFTNSCNSQLFIDDFSLIRFICYSIVVIITIKRNRIPIRFLLIKIYSTLVPTRLDKIFSILSRDVITAFFFFVEHSINWMAASILGNILPGAK